MDHELQDFEGSSTPKVQLELLNDLQNLEGAEQPVHLQFQHGENPFSYYHEQRQADPNQEDPDQNDNILHPHSHRQQQNDPHFPEAVDPLETLQTTQQADHTLPTHNLLMPSEAYKTLLKQPQIVFESQNPLATFNSPHYQSQSARPGETELSDKPHLSSTDTTDPSDLNTTKPPCDPTAAKKKIKIFDNAKQDKLLQEVNADKGSLVASSKTYTPNSPKVLIPPSPQSSNQKQLQLDEIRMLIKMGFEKKKANYAMLKEWDLRRAQKLGLHGRLIELLRNEVDLRIKSSLQNFEYYQTFFREKAKQEEKYVTSPVINTRYALQNNSLSKNVYINCSVILNSLSDDNTARCKRISDFIMLIRTNILKDLTENHLNSSQKQLLTIRQKISSLKSSLKKYNTETEDKANELANLFSEQSLITTNKLEKDFYRTQLSFLRKALQQIEVQTKLGQSCLEYYHTAIQQQLKRSEVIRQALVIYSQGLKQTYNLQLQLEELDQANKDQQIKQIHSFYSLEQMFDQRTIELFKLKNSIKTNASLSLDVFTTYINQFHYDYFDSRVILLKEFYVKSSTSGKSKQTIQQNCYLAITVDNFLHLFFNWNKTDYQKPDVTIKISNKYLEVKIMKEEVVDIIKREQRRNTMMSYFWDSKIDKIYRIKFNKKDNKQEFLDYISKLMADNY